MDCGAKEDFVPIWLVNIPELIFKSITGTEFAFFGRMSNGVVLIINNIFAIAVDREEPKALVFKILQSIPATTSFRMLFGLNWSCIFINIIWEVITIVWHGWIWHFTIMILWDVGSWKMAERAVHCWGRSIQRGSTASAVELFEKINLNRSTENHRNLKSVGRWEQTHDFSAQ